MVFDCDGLLIDSEVRWAVAERRVVEQHGGDWSEELRERLVGGSGENTATHIAEWVGLPETAVGGILVEVYDSYLAVIDELGVEPMPGARSLVAALAGRLPLAVASNTREQIVRATLAASGLPAGLRARLLALGGAPAEARARRLPGCLRGPRGARVRGRRVRGLAARVRLGARGGPVS